MYDQVTWMNLKTMLPKIKTAKILDAGGGTGYCAVPLAKMGYNVTLVDISEGMMKVAKNKISSLGLSNKVKFYKKDLRNLDIFESNMFDMVICQGSVLPCIYNYRKALNEMARVLKKNCLLNLSVHNKLFTFMETIETVGLKDALKIYQSANSYWYDSGKKIHVLRIFSPTDLENEMKRCGVKPLKIIGKVIIPKHVIEKSKDLHEISQIAYKLSTTREFFGYAKYLDITGVKL